jgi:hypothetical protein
MGTLGGRIRILTTESTKVTEAGKKGIFRILDPNLFFLRTLRVLCALCG